MEKINNRKIYEIATSFISDSISRKEAINKLVEEIGMKEGYAGIIIHVIPLLFEGKEFKRTLKTQLFDDLIAFYIEDYGVETLPLLLKGLKLHIDYIQQQKDPKIKLRKVYKKYLNMLESESDILVVSENVANDKKEELRNYRDLFTDWIKRSNGSGSNKDNSYLKAIDILSNILNKDIYGEDSLDILNKLYNDLLKEQKNLNGKYYHSDAPSYGKNGFYSAAVGSYIKFLKEYKDYYVDNEFVDNDEELIIEELKKNKVLTTTEKQTVILSRIGQGGYRRELISLWKSCSISKYNNPDLLIASHIKPWKDSTNEERVDKYNGLLLLPTYDKLFDLGYISFSDSGEILLSKKLKDFTKMGLSKSTKIKVKEENKKYLEYHRREVFIGDLV